MRARAQLNLALSVGAARPRTADRHAPPAERDFTGVVAVTDRGPVRIVAAFSGRDLVDF